MQGRVIKKFALKQGQQGIDIQSTQGASVVATHAGEVVYAGNGLPGYGNLVIVKHSERFLSAYAHNKNIFVSEGEQVKSRQKIGSIGANKTGNAVLHFQVREYGKPVDPLRYLKS